jgi:hypothetical protein
MTFLLKQMFILQMDTLCKYGFVVFIEALYISMSLYQAMDWPDIQTQPKILRPKVIQDVSLVP